MNSLCSREEELQIFILPFFYIPNATCINYFPVAVKTIVTKRKKRRKKQKGRNTIKRKVCFSLRFQGAKVHHSEEGMVCWQELKTVRLDLLCTCETQRKNRQEMGAGYEPSKFIPNEAHPPGRLYILKALSYPAEH